MGWGEATRFVEDRIPYAYLSISLHYTDCLKRCVGAGACFFCSSMRSFSSPTWPYRPCLTAIPFDTRMCRCGLPTAAKTRYRRFVLKLLPRVVFGLGQRLPAIVWD